MVRRAGEGDVGGEGVVGRGDGGEREGRVGQAWGICPGMFAGLVCRVSGGEAEEAAINACWGSALMLAGIL